MSELAKVEQNQVATSAPSQPVNIIEMAVRNGMTDAESLKVLYELQKEERAAQAKAAYDKAMAGFNANPPTIVKDKQVSFNATNYKHATLANVVDKIKTSLASHGLSLSWRTEHRENGQICVTAIIAHELGHSESTTMCGAPDNSGKKNAIQQIGSTVTYLERYTALALTGLAAFDDDAQAATATIDEAQIQWVNDMMGRYIQDYQDFLHWLGVDSVDSMTKAEYDRAVTALKTMAEQQGV